MPVVTISRRFAAVPVAAWKELASRLGAELLDREIVAAVAERAGIPEAEAEGYDERVPGAWQRIAAALAVGSPDPAVPALPASLLPDPGVHDRMARLTRAVIEEAAERGNAVIVGRGAACILGRRPGTLHVSLHAPIEHRVRLLHDRVEEIPPDVRPDDASLTELCHEMDRRRGDYVRRHFGVDWRDPARYDLAIETSRIPLDAVIDLMEHAARRVDRPGA